MSESVLIWVHPRHHLASGHTASSTNGLITSDQNIITLLRYLKKLFQLFIWRAIWYFCTFCAEARIDLVHLGTDKLSLFADTPLYTGTLQT